MIKKKKEQKKIIYNPKNKSQASKYYGYKNPTSLHALKKCNPKKYEALIYFWEHFKANDLNKKNGV